LLAMEKARQIAQSGMNVLLLCYNRPLADALAIWMQHESRVTVLTFHQLCDLRVRKVFQSTGRNLLEEAIDAYPGESDKQRFDVQMPYALALSNELLEEKFDAIVIDEAQDFNDEYWFSVEELLRDQDGGYLFIFIDENQALYPRHGNLPVKEQPYKLISNCRNTAQIHEVGYAFYQGESVDFPDLPGPPVERIAIERADAQADAIVRRVRRLTREEAINPEDVVILIAKRPKAHMYELLLERAAIAEVTWAIEIHGRKRCVLVDTVARFKGLESQVIILWLGDEIVDEQQWETVYVGSTRAKSLLCMIGSPKTINTLKTK